jgi:YVTN family beta-propeller protein
MKAVSCGFLVIASLSIIATLPAAPTPEESDRLKVGLQADGSVVVPTNQVIHSAGKEVAFPGRPVDCVLAEGGRTLVVKNLQDLLFIDTSTARIRQTLVLPRPAKKQDEVLFSVVGLLANGDRIYASDSQNGVRVARRQADGNYAWDETIAIFPPAVKGSPHPAGLAFDAAGDLWVTATRANNVQRLSVAGKHAVAEVSVGVAPFAICFPREDRCYVTNWGGDPPRFGDPQSLSSGTPVRIDARTNVANDGTVSILGRDGGNWKQLKTLRVGLHPSGMARGPGGRLLYVANANSDTVSVIDVRSEKVIETIPCRPEGRLPFGSGSNALAVSPDGATLYVANGTNNCIAVIALGTVDGPGRELQAGKPARVLGLIPTAWYPGGVAVSPDGKRLFVANIKGHGSLSQPRPLQRGKNSHDYLGSVSLIDVPDALELARYTEAVNRYNRLAFALSGLEPARRSMPAVAVPTRHGEPSLFEHVLYIIKENRTYDQVFGDMREGNGDPSLCIFGEETTPNHHALARQFSLFDNFYCSGVLSADGHSWADAAYVTDYLERAFGGFVRSYPDDGKDALAFPSTGFLWDNALAKRKTLRNYGEFVAEEPYTPKGTTWSDVYADHVNGTRKILVKPHVTLKSLEPYTHPNYPYFPLTAPDVYRADLFIEEFHEFEKKGMLPNLLYMSLPCDHTNGTRPGFPTPRAMVADNDRALGRIVEAVSNSKFWATTCIFVVEDDPQAGFDHVDGHRTVALVISPYTRRGFVDHTQYTQVGMVKTIELVLGLPPMHQLDLAATPIRACFQDKPDLKPYTSLPNRIKLDEMNPLLDKLRGQQRFWAEKSLALELDKADEADEDTLNRILWHSVKGYETPYPKQDDDD